MQNKELAEKDTHKYLSFHRFLDDYGIDSYKMSPLQADCSNRRYYRVVSDQGTHILMDSSRDASIGSFLYIGSVLRDNGLRAPEIFKYDPSAGYLLTEDFGNTQLTQSLIVNPENELLLYELCTKALIKLSEVKTADLRIPQYSHKLLNKELHIFNDWYVKYNIEPMLYQSAYDELESIFNELYHQLTKLPQVLILRDFMADNLMVLDSSSNLENLGIIDFQDAVIGNCAYDLVSLLEDARRDVSPAVASTCKDYFCKTLDLNIKDFDDSYTILGLHRNLKIIGIFNRRSIRDSEHRYLEYMPRVWKFIRAALETGVARPLKNWFDKYGVPIK
jgi:aminoglycoside/choline kinase family phosphotransferase